MSAADEPNGAAASAPGGAWTLALDRIEAALDRQEALLEFGGGPAPFALVELPDTAPAGDVALRAHALLSRCRRVEARWRSGR